MVTVRTTCRKLCEWRRKNVFTLVILIKSQSYRNNKWKMLEKLLRKETLCLSCVPWLSHSSVLLLMLTFLYLPVFKGFISVFRYSTNIWAVMLHTSLRSVWNYFFFSLTSTPHNLRHELHGHPVYTTIQKLDRYNYTNWIIAVIIKVR